jgi:uncharacterized membrane protein YfcA
MIEILSYIAIGALAGIMGGLLGISGGVVTVPSLFFLFQWLGMPQSVTMHIAIGTSLAAMVVNGAAASWFHNARGTVRWSLIKQMAPGLVIGSIIGAVVANWLSTTILEMVFGAFLCLLALHFFKKAKPHKDDARLPGSPLLTLISAGIAALSNVLGIGGGIITVPVLMHYRIASTQAIACSAATGFIISLMGALAYLYVGWGQNTVPMAAGYLYLPAFVIVSLSTVFAARFGVKLAYYFSPALIRRIFACALLAIGALMLFFK